MSKHGSLRGYCNSWLYQMIDKYFREVGMPKWIWNDAGARLHITAVAIGSIANSIRFPSKPVFDRIVEMARPLGWTDADKIFGYIARDYVIKNEHLPSGLGNGGWGGFLVSYVVKCINDILPENEELEVYGKYDDSTMASKNGGVEAKIIIEKEDLPKEIGLTPKEFLEQNGWFDKKKTDSEKPLGWSYDIAEHFPKYTEIDIDDHQEIDDVEEGYNNLLNNIEIVPKRSTLIHDKASCYDRFINELCENISYTNIAKCLYGSELDPEEFIQVYKMLTGYPTCGRSDVRYSYISSNPPASKTLDEQLLNKIIIAVIRKVAQEIKDSDKED